MAGSDPRSGRAPGPVPNRGNVEAEEDPLVELARIVSEDGGFSTPKTEKPKMNRNESTQRSAYADGLEAELLQELESTLGGRDTPPSAPQRPTGPRQVATPPSPRVVTPQPQARPSAEAERDPDDLLRSIEEQLGQFERRQAERSAVTTETFTTRPHPEAPEPEFQASDESVEEALAALANEPLLEEQPEEQPKETWMGGRVTRLRPLDDDEDLAAGAPEPNWEPEPESFPAPRAEYRFRGPATAGWDHPAAESRAAPSATPREEPHPDEPSVRRVESLEGFADEPSDADLFAPTGKMSRAHDPFVEAEPVREVSVARASAEATRRRRVADAFPEFDDEPAARDEMADRAAINARLAQALESDFADASHGKPWQNGGAPEADEPKVAAAIAPGASRRAAAARAQAAQRSKGARTALFTIVGVVLVVLIGGAAALFLRSTETGPAAPPPVITADEGPVKVTPPADQASTDSDTTGDAVYNRVAGNAPAATSQEKVVDNAEEPREVARIVLPSTQSDGSDTVVRPVGEAPDATDSVAADETAPTNAIGPRKVPTFTVRPDGTIVANSDGDAGASSPQPSSAAPQPSPAQQVAAAEPEPAAAAARGACGGHVCARRKRRAGADNR